jgi:hypothetical protein
MITGVCGNKIDGAGWWQGDVGRATLAYIDFHGWWAGGDSIAFVGLAWCERRTVGLVGIYLLSSLRFFWSQLACCYHLFAGVRSFGCHWVHLSLSYPHFIVLRHSVFVFTRISNMRSFPLTLLALTASTSSALNIWPRKELQSDFAGCGRDAHGAIRAPFHDCINNGCDGSLILSDECSRPENAGLSDICTKLLDWSTRYDVSAADMIQFAAATAISQCPLGPKVQALVGRKDKKKAAHVGSVPSSRDPVEKILGAFGAKGFSAQDVVALMGTHSVAVQLHDDPAQAGKSLDSTPSVCDMTFYKETKDGTAPYSLQSDRLLSNSSQVYTSSHLPILLSPVYSQKRLK